MSDKKQYLGDGVYANFDGHQICLTANVPTTDTVYLEPSVAVALVKYIDRVYGERVMRG